VPPWEAWQRPPGQEDLHRDLLDPVASEKWDLSETVAPELYGQWLMVLAQARKYLTDKWPIYDDPDSLGPANFALAKDEYLDAWELIRSLDGIDGVLADFESFVLNREQVEALAACFPEFYAQIQKITREQLLEMQLKGRDLPWQKGDMLRVLLNIPDATPLASQPTTQQQPSKPPKPRTDKQLQETRTPAERVEANEAAG
jgi:hypothetical protein